MAHKIIVVGIGPGAAEYLLPVARRHIEEAAVLVGSKRALADYGAKAAATCSIGGDLDTVMKFIAEHLPATDVVVMVSGDPGYYSLLPALQRTFPAVEITVIPGVSSVQLAFARLGLAWQNAKLLSFHGRVPDDAYLKYQRGSLLGMLTDNVHNTAVIARILLAKGWPSAAKVGVCARLSYEDERVFTTTLGETAAQEPHSHCIMVVIG